MSRFGSFVKEINNRIKDFTCLYKRKGIKAIIVFGRYLKLHHKKKLRIDEFLNYGDVLRNESFQNSFLSLQESYIYLRLLNPNRYATLARDKYLTHLLLERNCIPTPELYAYYNPERHRADFAAVFSDLRSKNVSSCVVKPAIDSAHGEGVFVCNRIEYQSDDCILIKSNEERVSLRAFCEQNKMTPFLFESKVIQCEQMSRLNQSSVNTIRFMTALYPDGSVDVFATFMRIGRTGSDVDNAGGGGNVDCAINADAGICYNALQFNSFSDIIKCDRHPDSGVLINGMCIENWGKIKALICDYQSRIPQLKAIGWDVALTDQGPMIIEINNWWDTTGQLFIGKGWREDVRNCFLAWQKHYGL